MLLDEMREELVRGLTDIFQDNISMIILYGSVARNEAADESDIDIAIILKNQIDHKTKQQFFRWVADLDMIVCFLLWIYRKTIWRNGGTCIRFIRIYARRGSFYGRQLKM